MRRYKWELLALVMAFVVTLGSGTTGHTPISSRWSYNEHLFPIFRDQCGSCHIDGGIAPMSLMTYQDAYPWTQSIREEILGLRMPPWQAEDGFGMFRNGHALSARDMDMILEWSSGGYPQGPRDQVPPAPELSAEWTLGEPALTLDMPDAFEIDAGTRELVRYFVLAAGTDADQAISAVDLQPGARAVVRSAAVFVDSEGAARALDDADPAPGFADPADGAFHVAAGSLDQPFLLILDVAPSHRKPPILDPLFIGDHDAFRLGIQVSTILQLLDSCVESRLGRAQFLFRFLLGAPGFFQALFLVTARAGLHGSERAVHASTLSQRDE